MSKIITCTVDIDDNIRRISKNFDYEFHGVSEFKCHSKPIIPDKYNIGLIVGSSGSGKSQLLLEFGECIQPKWDNYKGIISHFENEGQLMSCGLNSIPAWCRPYHVLSTGEKHRADCARMLVNGGIIDEFTSVVDRNTAISMAISISKYIRKNNISNVVIATCHRDIIDWLCPDWIFDTDSGEVMRGNPHFQYPKINVKIFKSSYDTWRMFENHHYLTQSINKSCKCYIATWNEITVGFVAVIAMPCGSVKNAYRESRLVVLPQFQGMGIGTAISDAIADIYVSNGYRYFSRTAHIRMGTHRDNSKYWKKTSKYKKVRIDAIKTNGNYNSYNMDCIRSCYSHEYVKL